ncbi:MAG: sortase [Bacilli bacterium]|nr:sortase [Bacilli bacterium]
MLKRIIKLFIFISSFFLFIPTIKEYEYKRKVKRIIKENNNTYLGYISIPKFNYENVIDNKDNALDNNQIYLTDFSDKIGGNNIVLAGHNNRYVFNKIYYLNVGDSIIISDFNMDYLYEVIDSKYINVDDFDSLKIDNSLILLTCSSDNQKRYIVISIRK